jgi:hypothetical protein
LGERVIVGRLVMVVVGINGNKQMWVTDEWLKIFSIPKGAGGTNGVSEKGKKGKPCSVFFQSRDKNVGRKRILTHGHLF